eukprot:UN29301
MTKFIQLYYSNASKNKLQNGINHIFEKFGNRKQKREMGAGSVPGEAKLFLDDFLDFYKGSYEEKPKAVEEEMWKRGYQAPKVLKVEKGNVKCCVLNGLPPVVDGTIWDRVNVDNINTRNVVSYDVLLLFCDSLRVLRNLRRMFQPHMFVIVWSKKAVDNPEFRQVSMSLNIKMLTNSYYDVIQVVNKIVKHKSTTGPYQCPYCAKKGFTEDNLWEHAPLYHISVPNKMQYGWVCPICEENVEQIPFQVHLRNRHGPCGRGEVDRETRRVKQLAAFALVVCRREDGKYLLVQESADKGYWLPGCAIDPSEGLTKAAKRETLQEAGIQCELQGFIIISISCCNPRIL